MDRLVLIISLTIALLIAGQTVSAQGTSGNAKAASGNAKAASDHAKGTSAHARQTSEHAGETSGTLYGTVDPPPRDTGHLTLQTGVGSVNGARLGLQYYLSQRFSAELSAGYLSITLVKELESREFADALSVSGGLNYFSHPESAISPTVALMLSYIQSLEDPEEFTQQRYALTPMIGTEYYVAGNLLLFFRFGPSLQYIDEGRHTSITIEAQFDAGIGWTF